MPTPSLQASSFSIRPAVEADASTIKSIVRQAGINPFELDWQRFLVAEKEGRLIATGQVKPHPDGSRELASIAVVPEYQGQGLGFAVVNALKARSGAPLYLMCRATLQPFYQRLGFRVLTVPEMPPYFRRIFRLMRAVAFVPIWKSPQLVVMLWGE